MFVLLLEMGTEGSVVRYRGVAGGPVAQWALQTHDWVGVQAATVFLSLEGCVCAATAALRSLRYCCHLAGWVLRTCTVSCLYAVSSSWVSCDICSSMTDSWELEGAADP